jgi:hypothetical protein
MVRAWLLIALRSPLPMTERSLGVAVVTTAAALFCTVLIFLALQLRAGRDPALGAAQPQAAPRQLIVRRIIVRRIVKGDSRGPVAATSAPEPAPAPVVSRGS